ncbi:hypothetical protein KUTeg_005161, partial [Tegillarca granosa]
MNYQRDNAILIQPPFSGSSHAKSSQPDPRKGWWEKFIGPGLAIDTDKYFVICTDNIGGCYGSSGPSTINPITSKPYGMSFPSLSVEDIVRGQFLVLDSLGIDKVYACIGGSLGGMCSITAAVLFSDRVGRAISLSAAIKTYPSTAAWNHVQRQVIMSDPNWNAGVYSNKLFPSMGLNIARQIGTISYRGFTEFDSRFKQECNPNITDKPSQKSVYSYLEYQGNKFANEFDPNSYIYLTKVMLLRYKNVALCFKRLQCLLEAFLRYAMDMFNLDDKLIHYRKSNIFSPVLVIGAQSDILYPVWQQKELVHVLQNAGNPYVEYVELDANTGHDTFLIDYDGIAPKLENQA